MRKVASYAVAVGIVTLAGILAFVPHHKPPEVTPRQLVENPDAWDGVTVRVEAVRVRRGASRRQLVYGRWASEPAAVVFEFANDVPEPVPLWFVGRVTVVRAGNRTTVVVRECHPD